MRLSTLFAFLRHRWLWWFLGALVTFPVLVLVLCYLWLLPNLPAYKDDIASLLSSATGYTITLERIHGERGGAHPRLLLEGVRIAKDGHPLLHFSKIDGRLGWRTLLTLEPRFHSLVVEAPALTVRRTSDGMFQVGGLRTDPNSTDTAFSDWLLKQGSVSLQGATIAWINDQHASPPLVMRNVGFKLQSLFTRHAFEVDMTPPAWLSKPLQIKGVMYGRSLSKRQNWHGALKLNLSALEMAAWRPWLPAEYTEVRGHGGLTGTLSVQHGRLTEANFNLNLADLNMRLPQLSSPMELASIKGELGWKRETHDAHEITTLHVRNLSLNSRNGVKLAPFDFSWRRGDGEQTVTAKHLPLGQLTAIANELPLSSTHKAELRTLALKGLINSLDISWHDQPGQQIALPEVFSVDVRFTGLGWAAEGQRPGAANLSGNLSGNEKKGHYLLTGTQAGFDLPAVFADPALRFDHMNMRGGWTRHASQGQQPHINIDIAEALLSNADVTARLHGQYRLLENGPGYADLSGNVERGKAARVVRYLPLSINSMTHDWLRSSVLQGEIREGSFKLQGDLARFPFRSKQDGIFQVYGRFDAGLLRYAHNYPAINDIDGEFIMDGIRLEVRSDKARVFGAQLRKVTAAINDFASAKELLEIKGEAHGPMTEFLRFVNFSPVAETLENLTEEITANGDARLQLNIKIPLRHVQNATTSGRLSFLDNTIYPGADIPRIEHVNGQLDFTERAIIAPKITAHILGGPAALNINTENQQVRILGHGVFHAAALESWLGKAAAARLSGQSRWQGELNIGGGKNRMRFESNLAGLELRLPAPLRKPAATASLLAFDMQATDSGTRLSHLQYGNIASAAWASTPSASGYRMARGELRFGGKAKLPNTPGLQIAGTVGNFDLGGWTDLLPEDANVNQRS